MKNFLKKNKIFLLTLLVLILWASYVAIYFYINKVNNRIGIISEDPIYIFFSLISNSFWIFQLIFPIFVIVPATWNFNKKMNSGFIKNYVMRMKYKNCLKSFYKEALKAAFIVPIFFLFLLFLCCILAGGFKFGSSIDLYNVFSTNLYDYASQWKEFTFVYFFNLIMYGIFYVNLSLICCRKKANLAISIVLSFVVYFSLEIFINLFCGLVFSRLLDIHYTVYLFSLTGAIVYERVKLEYTVIYSICLVIISSFILYLTYKNEEKVLIEYEKQN